MHWFWQATIAVTVGWLSWVILAYFHPGGVVGTINTLIYHFWPASFPQISPERPAYLAAHVVPPLLMTLTTFGVAGYIFKTPKHRETRCRKCGYILRGISEPRCPECGERI